MSKLWITIQGSFDEAWRSIMRQRKRTILTMLAIAIGIASVITISAAGKGIERFVLGQLEVFGADTVFIEVRVPPNKHSSNQSAAATITITTLKDRDIDDIVKHPNIVSAYGMLTGQEGVSYDGQLKKIMLLGRGSSMPEVERVEVEEGRFFTEEEENSLAQVVVLGSKAKEKLFGDDEASGKTILIKGRPFRVVGSLEPRGSAFFFDMDTVVILPTKTMQKKMLGIDYVQAISAKMENPDIGAQTKAEIEELIRENHEIEDPAKDDFMVNTTADAQKMLETVTGGLTMLLLALVCISLIVGGVGIMNIMYVSVAERTFEIGLRKAIGATSKTVLWQFLLEAVLVTVGGGILGVVFGAIVAYGIYIAATFAGFKWVYSISPGSVILAVGFSVVIGFIFGLYPARKAANLHPIEALRKD